MNNSLIVAGPLEIGVTGTELMITDVETEADSVVEHNIGKVEKLIKALDRRIDDAQNLVVELNARLQRDNVDLITEFMDLQREMEVLAIEIIKDSMQKQQRDDAEQSCGDKESFRSSDEHEHEVETDKKKISLKVRKLFKAIAMKTHPDRIQKNSDGIKAAKARIFIRAKRARDDDDYQALLKIADELKHLSSSFLSILLERLGQLKSELEMKRNQLKKLKSESSYTMAMDVKKGHIHVVNQHYRHALTSRIRDLKTQIAQLKNPKPENKHSIF